MVGGEFMKDYFKIQTIKNDMKESYKQAVEMYTHIVKYIQKPKDWQRGLECLNELNNSLNYVLTTSKQASLERKNSTLMNIYLKNAQEHEGNYNSAYTALFEIVVNMGGTL